MKNFLSKLKLRQQTAFMFIVLLALTCIAAMPNNYNTKQFGGNTTGSLYITNGVWITNAHNYAQLDVESNIVFFEAGTSNALGFHNQGGGSGAGLGFKPGGVAAWYVASDGSLDLKPTADLTRNIGSPTLQVGVINSGTNRVARGTAAGPSFSFTADPDTGIYSGGPNEISIVTAGSAKWTVNSSGHLFPKITGTYNIGEGGFNPLNISADGVGVFGGVVSGDDPVENTNFVTKGYADANYIETSSGFGTNTTLINSITLTNPGINLSNANLKIRVRGSDITGLSSGDTVTNWPAYIGGTFTNTNSTSRYFPTGGPGGNPAVLFTGATPQLRQDNIVFDSSFNFTFTAFAVIRVTNNPSAVSVFMSATLGTFYGGIEGMSQVWGTGQASDTLMSTGYRPSPGTNGYSDVVVFFRYNGTNKWAGDGINWDSELATNGLNLSTALTVGDLSVGGFPFGGYISDILVYNKAFNHGDCVLMAHQLCYDYGIPATYTPVIWCDGDSMTAGSGLASVTNAWPALLSRHLGTKAFVHNSGVSGHTVASILSSAGTTIFKAPGVPMKFVLFAGRNDLAIAGSTGTQLYDNVVSLCQRQAHEGMQTYYVSIPPTASGGANYETYRGEVNSLISNSWAEVCNGYVDMSRYSLFYTVSNSIVWQADRIHPNETGNEIIFNEVSRTIFSEAAGGGNAFRRYGNLVLTNGATIYGPISFLDAAGTARSVAQLNITNVTKTTNYTIVALDSGQVFSTVGGTTNSVLTLPTGVIGQQFGFWNEGLTNLTITAVGSDKIRDGSYLTAAAGSLVLTSNRYYHLNFIAANEWIVDDKNGMTPRLAATTITYPASTLLWTNATQDQIEMYHDFTGVTGTTISKNGDVVYNGAALPAEFTMSLCPGDYFATAYTVGTPVGKYSPIR